MADGFRRRVMEGRSVADYETEALRSDGSQVTISLSLAPIRDRYGRVSG